MINPDRPNTYYGEDALNLYHFYVNELNSKIIDDEYLKVGKFTLLIEDSENENRGEHDWQILQTYVSYRRPGYGRTFAQFSIKFERWGRETPLIEIGHFRSPKDAALYFPLNDVIVKEDPTLCFNKWMGIVVDEGDTRVQQQAKFDKVLQFKENARGLKDKIEFLMRCSNKRPSHSIWNSIISDENLRNEIFQNGTNI
jgi:hypothetical protein